MGAVCSQQQTLPICVCEFLLWKRGERIVFDCEANKLVSCCVEVEKRLRAAELNAQFIVRLLTTTAAE